MINKSLFNAYANDPARFRDDLLVDVDGVARQFDEVMDPWQRQDFSVLDPALRRCAGRSDDPAKMRAYLERPRGHSKTHDLAVLAAWSLAFATRPIRGYAFAADRDQAALLKDAMQTIVRLNPWLTDLFDVQRDLVTNRAEGHPGKGGRLDIFPSDVASSYGILPDVVIADELCHWQGDGSLWHSILSSAAKRSNCFLCIISNAGMIDTWQWPVREAARTDDDWIFSRLDGPVASWLPAERLEEQRRMLPAVAYSRLWENNWSTGGGDALTPDDIDAIFRDDLKPLSKKVSGYSYVAGADLGLTRDCSAVVVLGIPHKPGAIRLVRNLLWQPVGGKKIDLNEVEAAILRLDSAFGLEYLACDPWQAELLMSRIEQDGNRKKRNSRRRFRRQPFCREIPPTGSNLREQASLTLEYFGDRRIESYPCPPLRRDLMRVRCEERSFGFRLVSPRDNDGHGDTFSAFALALMIGHEVAGKPHAGTKMSLTSSPKLKETVPPWARDAMREIERRKRDREYLDSIDHDPLNEMVFFASGGKRGRPPWEKRP